MNKDNLESRLQNAIDEGAAVYFKYVTRDRYIVYVPEMFLDGNQPAVILKRCHGKWRFTDDGNTFLRLGKGSVEVSQRVWPEVAGFSDNLRNFVSALLLIESARSAKGVAP